MRDTDPEYEEIKSALTRPVPLTRRNLTRRTFLKAMAAGAGMAAMPAWMLEGARAAGPLAAGEGVLVVVQMGGGNDGLNTVVPTGNAAYYDARASLAIPEGDALPIGQGVGLHPSLANLQARFESGQVAIVQGVAYPKTDMSHFQSMANWMSGWAPGGATTSGWLGRYLDAGDPQALAAVNIGSGVPMHLQGERSAATALPSDKNGLFGVVDDPNDEFSPRLFDGVRSFGSSTAGMGQRASEFAIKEAASMDRAVQVSSCYVEAEENSAEFVKHMGLAARLINANLGLRVVGVSIGNFDTHDGQAWQHEKLLGDFDKGVEAFFSALTPQTASKVTLMTFSEFGRRVETSGGGTDHGSAGPMFVMGAGVAGGLIGDQPSLTKLDASGNMTGSIPFHGVYATVLDKWLGADSTQIVGATQEMLPLFANSPA